MHQRVLANVRQILGPDAKERDVNNLARASWRNYLRYLQEFVSLPHVDCGQISRLAERIEGGEHIQELVRQGRGPVVVSAHFGNWDIAAALGARFWPVNVIADTFRSHQLDRMVNAIRTAQGIRVIPIERAAKRALGALRRNEAVAFLVDKPLGTDGVTVDFFGRRTQIPGGAGFFALKANAPILPAFVWRNPDNSYSGRVWPPIQPTRTGDLRRDVGNIMQQVMSVVEEMIRANPEHWYMFRNMWPKEVAVA